MNENTKSPVCSVCRYNIIRLDTCHGAYYDYLGIRGWEKEMVEKEKEDKEDHKQQMYQFFILLGILSILLLFKSIHE